MRSGEIARLAGVSVRTLRHYHHVGVLPEPDRASNGYRTYDVHDLVRLLRIRRLAALGVSLDLMPTILDGSDAAADGFFDDLDAELAGQIDRLTQQREIVAVLRSHGAFPDLPPELAPFQAAFEAAGLSREMARIDRDQAVLLAQLVGRDGMEQLIRVYEWLAAPGRIDEVAAAMGRLARLGADADETLVAQVADGLASSLRPLATEMADSSPALDERVAGRLLGDHSDSVLNDAQRRVMRSVEALLRDPAV